MMKKRLFKAALMAAALALLPMSAWAQTAMSGRCGANLTWTLDALGKLTVIGSGEMYNYDDENNDKWDKELITGVEIGPGVTSIGSHCFSYCKSLTMVMTYDDGLATIGDFAFMGCAALRTMTISNSVTTVKQYAFGQCRALEAVVIGTKVSDIGLGAFSQCGSLESIKVEGENTTYDSRGDCNAIIHTRTNELVRGCRNTVIPNTVTSIENGAFGDCKGLEFVSIPNSVTKVGQGAFGSCADLKTVAIGSSVASIAKYTFMNCLALERVVIGGSVASIGEQAFLNCYNLATIVVKATTPPTCGIGVFANVPNATCKLAVPEGSSDHYKAADTWKDFANIKTIEGSGKCGANIEWTLDSDGDLLIIGEGDMYNYNFTNSKPGWRGSPVKSARIEGPVTTIGGYAFLECAKMTSIKMPNTLTGIGRAAFYRCYELQDINLPDNLTDIKMEAFKSCRALKKLVVPMSVTGIGVDVLAECNSLESIEVEQGNTVYDSRDNCNAIIHTLTNELVRGCQNTVIPNDVVAIGRGAFNGSTGLKSLDIPLSVTAIGTSAFYSCINLTGIVLPPELTVVESYAFFGCKSLECVVVPDKVETIRHSAFSSCQGLKEIMIGRSVATIERYAFNRCGKLERITVLASVPPVIENENAFDDVDKETCRLTVPSAYVEQYKAASVWKDFLNVEAIAGMGKCGDNLDWMLYDTGELVITGYGAMYDYEYKDTRPKWDKEIVKTVRIEGAATNIGKRAFEQCSNMTDIKMPNTITKIGSVAFSSCYALTDMALPNTVTALGSWAYSHCRSLTKVYIPKSLTDIGNLALIGCENVTSMEVEQGNPVFDSRDNCNAIIMTATNTLVAGSQNTVIPSTETSIGGSAFYDCKNLTNIVIPTSVTTIESAAFYRCYKL